MRSPYALRSPCSPRSRRTRRYALMCIWMSFLRPRSSLVLSQPAQTEGLVLASEQKTTVDARTSRTANHAQHRPPFSPGGWEVRVGLQRSMIPSSTPRQLLHGSGPLCSTTNQRTFPLILRAIVLGSCPFDGARNPNPSRPHLHRPLRSQCARNNAGLRLSDSVPLRPSAKVKPLNPTLNR
jgi:hypothetical protein